ncbi:MAG: GNAT family N-acetyltransferase [Planctomycetes bacterium]|nr:GNAT family N-acetyltransferase [Planctomycetota bacterium]
MHERQSQPVVELRAARPEDAAAMAVVDRACWPEPLAADAAMFAARIAAFREGQVVAAIAGRIVGSASAQRITAELLHEHGDSYDTLTDHSRFTRSHVATGEIYQLVGVAVLSECRGLKLGRRLIDRQLELARALPGVKRIIGFTRPARYSRHQSLAIDDYVTARRRNGRLLDPVLAFHLEAGAQLVSICPGFRPADDEACGYGVLIEYPRSVHQPLGASPRLQ